MNFETVLFAAAFLLLAILTIPQNEAPSADDSDEASAISAETNSDDAAPLGEAELDAESADAAVTDAVTGAGSE